MCKSERLYASIVLSTMTLLSIMTGCEDNAVSSRKILPKLDRKALNGSIHACLTVEESIVVACMRSLIIERSWHLCKGVDPNAIPQITAILQDHSQTKLWPSAAEALSFVGGDAEALLLTQIIQDKDFPEDARLVRQTLSSCLLSLGLMARRDVVEAKKLSVEFCKREFWEALPVSKGNDSLQIDMRQEAIYAKAFADWGIDAQLYQQMRSSGDKIADYIKESDIEDVLGRMSKEEEEEISDNQRAFLAKCYLSVFK